MSGDGSSRRRVLAFAVIASVMLVLAVAFVARAMRSRSTAPERAEAAPPSTQPFVVFRNLELSPSEDFGKIARAPIDAAGGARELSSLRCVRVHYASGQGLCLEMKDDGGRETTLRTFGADLRPRWSAPVNGLPSRARVSPDGRYGAVTVFVTGHSYSDEEMSTRTTLVDMRADRILVEDLEKLELWKDGARFDAPDANYWGVTFASDPNRFYATVASGAKTWLVEGDIAAGRMRALKENVECPSISPDGARLGFKKRVGGPGVWRLHLLELATLEDRPLSREEHTIDDQVEWLDDGHLLYKHGANVWSLAIDGAAPPTVFLARGSSPAVVRSVR